MTRKNKNVIVLQEFEVKGRVGSGGWSVKFHRDGAGQRFAFHFRTHDKESQRQ